MATDDYQAPGQMNTQDLRKGLGKQGIQTGQVPREGEVPFTQKGLQNYLGPRFQVKPSRQGNLQVNIANMRASSDDDKLTLLYKARNMLRAVGFEASVKFTFRSQITNRFENWPCLWVDRGMVSEQTSNLGRIANRLEKLLARIEEVGGELPLDTLQELGGGDTFEEDREIEPSEEDMEHAAMIQRNKHQVARGQARRNQDPMVRTPTLNQPKEPWDEE